MLLNRTEPELILYLKKIYRNKTRLSEFEKMEMKEYETENYALLGIIGLVLQNNPRILLGRKQGFDQEIKQMCEIVEIPESDLFDIAEKYLDDDFSEENEFILRKVMLEYPKERPKENL